ncbi:MAG: GlsB/YeaQ/YmgE family stress response membrane protein [Methylobacteriaceae bacterium]|nr:GlsB/YeaQ/YmgE family stress response membrane protein [Methylobacteriaceae bacterium]MBV9243411.1 GlsB/YeaQ/YmgE family stress response membrane protein [Methylobacteriaceae bacterium]MBV9701819.1 GlsB/YeaQ/YmgE family stress response membrane protein [Methylobacteriaceae bacterium]
MVVDARGLIITIIIGLVAGWLASFVVGGGGILRYILTGLIGSFVGYFLLSLLHINLGIGNPIIDQIIVSTIGAIVVVLIARALA